MGWINDTTRNLAAFASEYPDAVVPISENDLVICAYNGQEAGRFIKVIAINHQKVTEYRGLSLATAQHLKSGLATFGKKDLVVKVGYSVTSFGVFGETTVAYYTARCASLLGTEKTAAISRANEAGGYVLTVTENTTRWGHTDATTGNTVYDDVTGEQMVYTVTGAGSATKGDVCISWGLEE